MDAINWQESPTAKKQEQYIAKKSIVDSDFTQKLRQGTSMFSRVGAGQSVSFMILDRAPEKFTPLKSVAYEDMDYDEVAADDDHDKHRE